MKLTREIGKKYFSHSFMLHYVCTTEMGDKNEVRYLHVMMKNGKAYCQIYQFANREDELYISDLHIDDSLKRQGIGTYIMNAFQSIGNELKAKLYLFCVEECWVKEWYQKLGFCFDGFFNEDENEEPNKIWMVKETKNNFSENIEQGKSKHYICGVKVKHKIMEQKSNPKKTIDLRKKFFKKNEKDIVIVKFANGKYGLYFPQNKKRILCNCGGHVFLEDYSEDLICKTVRNPNYQIVEIWNGVECYNFGENFDPFKDLRQGCRIWERNVIQNPVSIEK